MLHLFITDVTHVTSGEATSLLCSVESRIHNTPQTSRDVIPPAPTDENVEDTDFWGGYIYGKYIKYALDNC